MTELTPAERLRSHAERILDRTSVRERDREELVEELYGHLWQRWQDGIGAGLSGDEAADAAIAGFGDADRLGREMTSAYHSRLYASTIGVLLPAVAGSSDRPYGYGRSRALVFLTGFFTLVGGAVVANMQTPFRLLVSVLALLLAFFITVLAYRALARRQRWALVYVQVLALAFVAGWIVECVVQPVQVSLLGIVALVVLDAVFRKDLSLWVGSSRRTGKLLGMVIVVAVLLPYVPLAVGAGVAGRPVDHGSGRLHTDRWRGCGRHGHCHYPVGQNGLPPERVQARHGPDGPDRRVIGIEPSVRPRRQWTAIPTRLGRRCRRHRKLDHG